MKLRRRRHTLVSFGESRSKMMMNLGKVATIKAIRRRVPPRRLRL